MASLRRKASRVRRTTSPRKDQPKDFVVELTFPDEDDPEAFETVAKLLAELLDR